MKYKVVLQQTENHHSGHTFRHSPMPGTRLHKVIPRLFAGVVLFAGCGGGDKGPTQPQATAPTITVHPQDATADAGATVSFSVSASGSPPLSYQWRRDGAAVTGATASTFSLTSVSAADDGAEFSAAVSNSAGTVVSRAAHLTVRTPPTITAQPQSRSVLSGMPAVFSVSASGTALTYQWHRNGAAIPGATGGAYAVGSPFAGDDGAVYTVVVTNSLGNVASASALLTVNSGNGVRSTSYANAKGSNQGAATVPEFGNARAFGDFFGSGNRDYFLATLVYDPQRPQSEAQPGEFHFWRWTGSSYARETAKVDVLTGCLHPRKAVLADFNGDGRPDIFVACHGYDAPPFPGEANRVLLSQPSGIYANRAVASGLAGFYHSATAFDVNNDGHVDVVVTNHFASKAVQVFINDGQGNFTQRLDLSPSIAGPYFTVEAADVDGDGRIDLIAGGHDWENAESVVLLNNGSGSFASVTPRVLPRIANEGVVLDFIVLDADRNGVNEIYVVRTSGGDGTFYQSRTVQRVLWPSLASTILISARPAPWIDFLVPMFSGSQYQLSSDNTFIPFNLVLP